MRLSEQPLPYYEENGHFYIESNNVKDGKINRNSEIFINDEFYRKTKMINELHTHDLVMVAVWTRGSCCGYSMKQLDGTAVHALIMFQDYKVNSNPYFLNYQFQTIEILKRN